MHLLIWLFRHLDVDQHRREGAGDRRRGDKDIVNQLQCLWIAAGGDLADVPDDRLSRVEVRSADQQNSPLACSAAIPASTAWIKVTRDGSSQRRVVGQGILQGGRNIGPGLEDILAEIVV